MTCAHASLCNTRARGVPYLCPCPYRGRPRSRRYSVSLMQRVLPLSLMTVVASSARKIFTPPPNIQNVVIERCQKGLQSVEEAVELFDCMVNLKRRPLINAFNLLTATTRMKQYPAVISLSAKMNRNEGGIVPDACTYRILTHNGCRMNQTDLGFGAFASLMKRRFRPDTIIFNTLIRSFCSVKRNDKAVVVFDKMPPMDCERNVTTYNTIIYAYCKERSMSKALGLLQDMIFKGILPNVVTYSTIIDALCKEGSLEKALELLQEMFFKGIFPDVVTCDCVLLRHCALGKWKEAVWIFEQMVGRGILPGSNTFDILIDGFIRGQRMDEALNMFKRMLQEVGVKRDLLPYSCLIDGLCKVGRMEDARTLMDSICKEGMVEEAHKLVNVMIQRGIRPSVVTFNTLIDRLCKDRKMEDAQAVLDEMRDLGIYPNLETSNMLMDGLCKFGSTEDALARLEKMLGKWRRDPTAGPYMMLFEALCRTGMMHKASQLLGVMQQIGVQPDLLTVMRIQTRTQYFRNEGSDESGVYTPIHSPPMAIWFDDLLSPDPYN